ncbi:MAG TPA: right-handed parallel beta-helix repeat-containing protein [Planctomycetota bacterium]|nr:right-handed parallel beta-helix repeat-containing protein [Planctomycetota bacterium]
MGTDLFRLTLIAGAAWLIALFLAPIAAAGEPGYSKRVLKVGPDKQFKTVAAAARAVKNGDTVEIDAGLYKGDVASWHVSDVIIRGVGGLAHLEADGKDEGGKGIWVVGGRNVVIENIEFSGCKVSDDNGAGIRLESEGPTVIRNCYFHDNENGILGGHGGCELVVEYCEFFRNGHGDGYSHNMYIGNCRSFTLRHSYSHGAKVGHNVKSRAFKNVIVYNRIMDEADGSASYEIDLPNGGLSYIIGNVIQKGPKAQNSGLVAYAMEGGKNPEQELYVVNNTMVNDFGKGTFVAIRSATKAVVANNLFIGPGKGVGGKAEEAANLATQDGKSVLDRAKYDYRLAENSPARDKGTDPGKAGDFALAPVAQYVDKARGEDRAPVGTIDIGAYEFGHVATKKFEPGAIALIAAVPPPAQPKPEPKPEPAPPAVVAAPPPSPPPPVRTPEQICQGWLSMARNYKNAGMTEEAVRCLNKIIQGYPDSQWAAQAKEELKKP